MGRKVTGIGLIVGLLLGAAATPASAQPDFGVLFDARAIVGEKPFTCTKAGGVDPTGRGLTYPQLKDFPKSPGATANKDRVYRLVGTYLSAQKGEGRIDICGHVTKIAGIGPRCGWQKGYNGKGLIRYANGDIDKIDQLTWKHNFTVMIGRIYKYDEGSGQKFKPGRIIGAFQARPDVAAGESCTTGWNPANADRNNKGQGARLFRAHGAFFVDQSGAVQDKNFYYDSIDPKNDGKSSPTNIWGDKKDDKPAKPPQ